MLTPERPFRNPVNPEVSPDIFEEIIDEKPSYFELQNQSSLLPPPIPSDKNEKYVDKLDQKLLKRTQKGMSGVLPPPSVTVVHMSAVEILCKLEENKKYFWNIKEEIETYNKVDGTSHHENEKSHNVKENINIKEEIETNYKVDGKSHHENEKSHNVKENINIKEEIETNYKVDGKSHHENEKSHNVKEKINIKEEIETNYKVDGKSHHGNEKSHNVKEKSHNVKEKSHNVTEKSHNEEENNTSLNSSNESIGFSKSLLISVNLQEAKDASWPGVLNMRYHGLYHNCNKISEEIVDLCDKYQKRFVGGETQSTCTVFETQNLSSPVKRRMAKPKWGAKSPGRRLSHLARRRITFSSANLQAGSSSLAGSRARQILVDAKKIDLLNRRRSPRKSPRKTPRKTPKKTPSKSPKVKTRTPSSSAKKKLALRFRKLTGEFESVPNVSEMTTAQRALFKSPDKNAKNENTNGLSLNTKRALFQSPNRDNSSSLFTSKPQDVSNSEERTQLRRALFTSPRKMSPLKGKKSPFKAALKFGFENKRKRSDSDDVRIPKFPRSMSMDVRPSTSGINRSLTRTQSELNISLNRSQSQLELSDQHKKKLQWAVYGALQTQNISSSHPQWKVWASVLGRVTCRFFTSQMAARGIIGAKMEGGTTERMNRIARRHVISVIKGKSVDDIINEYIQSRPKVQKPQGYVAPEDFNNMKNKILSDIKENVFQDRANTMESWEKKKIEQLSKPALIDNKIERIRKVINFGDDR